MTEYLAANSLLQISCVVLAVLIFICLIRAILGPRVTDRIISINLISTKVIILICVLAVLTGEHYLVDIALVYALISFLAVVALVHVFHVIRNEKNAEKEEEHA